VKLLANENFTKASVLLLRSQGYDITSIGEDNPSISDKSVMQIAEIEQRIILTFDRDYGELIYKHNYKREQGIIYLRLKSYAPEEPAKHVDELLKVLKIQTNRSLTVYDGKNVRQRKY
jgi:predicted nuclease of predicted toxin-antitoxin system